jgi:2,4-dienoyl-CoA reductase-like NADH-dependent reductase (Old Yellow Enzyme family)
MSGTVTDKRIRSEITKLLEGCGNIYERRFEKCAPESFWQEIDRAEDELGEKLKPRPMSTMEIRQACMAYSVAFKRACDAGKTDTAPGADAG